MNLDELGGLLWACAIGTILGLGAWQTGASVILAVGIGFIALLVVPRLLTPP